MTPAVRLFGFIFAGATTFTVTSRAAARAVTTSIVCGWQSLAMRNSSRPSLPTMPCTIVIASAAAVPSSSSDALAIGRPVRSLTTVW